jgi:acyl carrier protein
MQREAFIIQTVDWLNRRVAPASVTVDADTRLFDAGIVDSLGILRLIAWTERAIGRQIQDREVRMDRFGSVRDIAGHFVEGFAEGFAERRCATERRSASEGFAEGARARSCGACGGCSRRAA